MDIVLVLYGYSTDTILLGDIVLTIGYSTYHGNLHWI